MLTIAHNGGVVIGAFDEGKLVGYILGFLGTDSESPDRVAMARLKHCSHQLGVHPDYRDLGLGLRLKIAQREAVIKDGVRLVSWTYDPLLSRNAHINIRLLGAVCHSYIREAYGSMRDGLNVGFPSDRFYVEWWVTSSRVVTRLDATRPPLDLAKFLSAGAQKLNPSTLGSDDLLYPDENPSSPQGNLLLVEIPPEYLEMKKRDIELASAWRYHTREIFEELFEKGYWVTDFVYLKGESFPRSYYILSHGESTLG
jgi:predicted GNAT superfamily acetyltransferase